MSDLRHRDANTAILALRLNSCQHWHSSWLSNSNWVSSFWILWNSYWKHLLKRPCLTLLLPSQKTFRERSSILSAGLS